MYILQFFTERFLMKREESWVVSECRKVETKIQNPTFKMTNAKLFAKQS